MSAKVVSIGIQKGGVSKSTTSSVLAYYLSEVLGKRVLCVDMDGQANLTQILTNIEDVHEFKDRTVVEAIMEQDARKYIMRINDNLHFISGSEDVNTLAPFFYITKGGKFQYLLKDALDKVKDQYDFCIIDNPPQLGELSILSLTASDYVLIPFETSKFCYSSLKSYLTTIEAVQNNTNSQLKVMGILRNMLDKRRTDNKYYSDLVKEEFGNICFNEIIYRRAEIGRLPALGLFENNEMKKIVKIYRPLMKEIMKRV